MPGVAPDISGWVAPGLEEVRAEFERNFRERGELGAAFAAEHHGTPVVDLWGGIADSASGRAWTGDTLQIIFSGSKGLVAVCMLMLLERGQLGLEEPVRRYWPEFATAGKSKVLVRDVLAHTARLPGIETTVSWREATDSRRMSELLASQPQSADPRAATTYHALTYGWLCGELLRRIDGRTIGRFFADEIAQPLELDLWIGLPQELEPRVTSCELADSWGTLAQNQAAALASDDLLRSVFANPVRYTRERPPFNEPEWHQAEIPAAGAIGTARSIARLYGHLDELISAETLARARRPLSRRTDLLLGAETAFGIGFQLQTPLRALGPPQDAFGHGGSGGSVHGCWPRQGIAFSYAMNLMRDDGDDDRASALLRALHHSVTKKVLA